MSESNPVYLKIESEKNEIYFTLQCLQEGELIDVEEADQDSACDINGIYAYLLVQALGSDKVIQEHMEKLLADFIKFMEEQNKSNEK